MRVWILVSLMLVSATVYAQRVPDASTSASPNYGNHAQIQNALERSMPGASNEMMMDLDSTLLSSAAKSITIYEDMSLTGTVRKMIGGLKSIQLRMFDVSGDVRGKIQPVRDLLKAPQWIRYAAYSSGQDMVEIWSGRDGDRQTGVLMLSVSGKRVFAMNVTGDIRPDQLVYLSGRFGLPQIEGKLKMRLDSPGAKGPVGVQPFLPAP